jgi:fatty acid desaturase
MTPTRAFETDASTSRSAFPLLSEGALSDVLACGLQIVTWYSVRYWTLWVLLIAWPFAALLTGCVTLLHDVSHWTEQRQAARRLSAAIGTLPMQIIAVATLAAGLILVVVALHMLAN